MQVARELGHGEVSLAFQGGIGKASSFLFFMGMRLLAGSSRICWNTFWANRIVKSVKVDFSNTTFFGTRPGCET